jgi:hypothetical protein
MTLETEDWRCFFPIIFLDDDLDAGESGGLALGTVIEVKAWRIPRLTNMLRSASDPYLDKSSILIGLRSTG